MEENKQIGQNSFNTQTYDNSFVSVTFYDLHKTVSDIFWLFFLSLLQLKIDFDLYGFQCTLFVSKSLAENNFRKVLIEDIEE